MVIFNLMPWRENQSLYEKQYFRRLLLSVTVVFISVYFSLHQLLKFQLHHLQQERNALQLSQMLTNTPPSEENEKQLHAFDQIMFELSRSLSSESICFSDIHRKDNQMILTGNADSSIELTDFLKRWSLAKYFSEIHIQSLKQLPNQHIQFQLLGIQNTSIIFNREQIVDDAN